jgi:gas vesicle protein
MNTLLVGVMTGLIAGLLLAPQPGKESCGMLKERFSSLRDQVMRKGSTNCGGEESLESTVRADYLH